MKAKELIDRGTANGWQLILQRSSHKVFKHPTIPYLLSISEHGTKDLGVGLASTLSRQTDGSWKGPHFMKFLLLLEQAVDGTWTGMAPDIPGLLMAAESRDALISRAPADIAMHLGLTEEAGLPLPEPRTAAELVEIAA